MSVFQNLSGRRFGRWIVIDRAPDRRPGFPVWNVVCDCGGTGMVRANILKNGRSQSCGCYMRERSAETSRRLRTKHGMAGTRVWDCWVNIKQRCYNPRTRGYQNYGARGVTICDRWLESFENFLADMGPQPTPKHTIDRIDSRGSYTPENCRWATVLEQQNNRSNNHRLTLGNTTDTITGWSRRTGFNRKTIERRIEAGWPVERALTKPPRPTGR